MRTISAEELTAAVARLCVRANTVLPEDVTDAMELACFWETWPLAEETLKLLQQNHGIFYNLALSCTQLHMRRKLCLIHF